MVQRQAELPIVYLAYHVPSGIAGDAPALEVLSTVLSGGRASRLYRGLVSEGQIALEAGGDYTAFMLDPYLFWFWATPLPGQKPETVEAALLAQMERLKAEPVQDEELQRAKNQIEADLIFARDSVHRRANQLAQLRVAGRICPRCALPRQGPRGHRGGPARGWPAPTFRATGRTSASSSPGADGVERERRWPAHLSSAHRLRPDGGRSRRAAGRARPGRGIGRAAALAHREVLPNGIVLLVAERPGVPIVAARVYVQGAGAAFDPADRQGLANLTAALLTRGTVKRTAAQIDAAIEFVGGRLEAGADRDGLVAAVDVLRKDLSLGLDLLSEVLLTPAFPPRS